MIQQAYITAWRATAPWQDDAQVEQYEQNLHDKQSDPVFAGDIDPLLNASVVYDPAQALQLVRDVLVSRIPGEPWRGANKS